MSQDMDLGTELSFLSLDYPVFRGNYPPLTLRIEREALQPSTLIGFSIHSLSHIDFPWCIEEELEYQRRRDPSINASTKPLPKLEEIERVMNSYLTPKSMECMIIDITHKLKTIKGFIDSKNGFLKPDLKRDTFEELMKSLQITKEDFKVPFEELKDKIVLFKTCYDSLVTRGVIYSNSYFEFRHPYLLSPYLEKDLIYELVDTWHILGIGSDTYGLENPIHFVSRHSLPDFTLDYYEDYKRGRPPFRPLLVKLMTERKYYIKNLRNLDKIDTQKGFSLGCLSLIPFSLGKRDGAPVRVFFKAGGR